MKKIPLTQGKFATVDDDQQEMLSKFKWHVNRGRYAVTNIGGRKNKTRIFMHHMVLGRPLDGMVVDHINGDSTDNRKDNLRICTQAENVRNQKIRKDSPFGYKGVMRNGKNGFMARIRSNGKVIYIATFRTAVEAAKAYNEAAIKYHGNFAYLNVIN